MEPSMTHEQQMEELRLQVSKGCEQVRQFEEKLMNSPVSMFPNLISDAASIIYTFVTVISQLNRGGARQSAAAVLSSPQLQLPNCSPNSSPSPMACSPIQPTTICPTPPHSPSPRTTSSSPVMTPLTTPEGSPVTPTMSDADDQALFTDQQQSWRSNRKRKCMPKKVVKLPANSTEHGETPQDDGYTWRKYGQKDILNSKFPRSYYRCTHQKELGCQATKYVQKCEEESAMYQVTYIGEHTCGGGWNSSNSRLLGVTSSTTTTARPLLESIHPVASFPQHSNTFSSSLFPSRLDQDMKVARLALSPSNSRGKCGGGASSGFNLLRPPSTGFASPSQWLTPKFGGLPCAIKLEPAVAPSSAAVPQIRDNLNKGLLLKMSLGSNSQAATSTCSSSSEQNNSSTTSELELWNLEELPGLLDNKVVVDTSQLGVSASLEEIPKTSINAEDISSYMLGEYDDDVNQHFPESLLFVSSPH